MDGGGAFLFFSSQPDADLLTAAEGLANISANRMTLALYTNRNKRLSYGFNLFTSSSKMTNEIVVISCVIHQLG